MEAKTRKVKELLGEAWFRGKRGRIAAKDECEKPLDERKEHILRKEKIHQEGVVKDKEEGEGERNQVH